jgi:hypothetical protein
MCLNNNVNVLRSYVQPYSLIALLFSAVIAQESDWFTLNSTIFLDCPSLLCCTCSGARFTLDKPIYIEFDFFLHSVFYGVSRVLCLALGNLSFSLLDSFKFCSITLKL